MPVAYIGLGANLPSRAGAPEATLAAAVERMQSLGRIIARSSLYSTEPVGLHSQPRFLNAVVALQTELDPRALLDQLLAIELAFGRDRSSGVINGPRTLDLDILLMEDVYLDEPDLQIPHPRLAERPFALVPLCEIAPDVQNPRNGMSVGQWMRRHFPSLNGANEHAIWLFESDVWRVDTGGAGPHDRLR